MKRFWVIFGVVVIAFIAGFVILNRDTSPSDSTDLTELREDDHAQIAPNQKVVLIEYADFQCPGCAGLFPLLQQAKQAYKDQVTFVYRYIPLTTIHPNAMAAARAAEAASRQDKFWQMHDLLFQNQNAWSSLPITQSQTLFETYASQIDLNIDQYKQDYSSSEVADRINIDVNSATKLEITSTPTLLLNGNKIDTPNTLDDFKRVLDEAIKNAGGTPPASTDNAPAQ